MQLVEHKQKNKYKVKLEEVELDEHNHFQKINCPSCSTHIPAKDINIEDKIAKCGSCDAVFPFKVEIIDTANEALTKKVVKPADIEVLNLSNGLDIEVQDTFGIKGFMATMSIISLMLTSVCFIKPNMFLIWSSIISWCFTFWYIYIYRDFTQKILLNIDNDNLTIEYSPWFFTRKLEIEKHVIKQIYSVQQINPYTGKKVRRLMAIIDLGNGEETKKLMP